MSKENRVFGKIEGCENLKGYTLYELFTLCRSVQENQESLEDCVGDLAVLPKVILDLVVSVGQLTTDLDIRTNQLNYWQQQYALLAKGKS